VALHPSRTIELDVPASEVFDRCISGIEQILGGNISTSDVSAGTIEANFGLINSERLTVTIKPVDERKTSVTIESRRGAILEQPQRSSSYVDALAECVKMSS
jgi:hypothetical protein